MKKHCKNGLADDFNEILLEVTEEGSASAKFRRIRRVNETAMSICCRLVVHGT
jgi:hypothetical protein